MSEGFRKAAFAFEKTIVEEEKATDQFPEEAIKIYKESAKEGVPTAYSIHPDLGKAVICTAGQGPMILWSECLLCPSCGGAGTYYKEYVFRRMRFVERRPEDGALVFNTGDDTVVWEDHKDDGLFCGECCHEWPIPEGQKIDFE